MIDVQHLTKSYGPRVAVDDVSFSIGKGEVVGFLGPNGAGKTTTMRILTGFLPATGGDVKVAGYDVFDEPMQVKRRVGYLPESPPLYPELSVGTYLEFAAELRGFYGKERLKRVGRVMEQVGLVGWEQRILGSLSKGYRQRVGLAQALVHEPEVLILDEPTSGLDPTQVMGMRELMRELAATRTVILSTHILGGGGGDLSAGDADLRRKVACQRHPRGAAGAGSRRGLVLSGGRRGAGQRGGSVGGGADGGTLGDGWRFSEAPCAGACGPA